MGHLDCGSAHLLTACTHARTRARTHCLAGWLAGWLTDRVTDGRYDAFVTLSTIGYGEWAPTRGGTAYLETARVNAHPVYVRALALALTRTRSHTIPACASRLRAH
jgi:hypothetical protein|eukprot:COSAG01_NODE_5418_length_4274_cov_12.202150_5_plen_106_part_00